MSSVSCIRSVSCILFNLWHKAQDKHGEDEDKCGKDEDIANGGSDLSNAASASKAVPSREKILEVVNKVVAAGERGHQRQVAEGGVIHGSWQYSAHGCGAY